MCLKGFSSSVTSHSLLWPAIIYPESYSVRVIDERADRFLWTSATGRDLSARNKVPNHIERINRDLGQCYTRSVPLLTRYCLANHGDSIVNVCFLANSVL
jgi:hypothetical protein